MPDPPSVQAVHTHLPRRGVQPGCAYCEASGNVFGGPSRTPASPSTAVYTLLLCMRARGWRLPAPAVLLIRGVCVGVTPGDVVSARCMPSARFAVVSVSPSGDTVRATSLDDGARFTYLLFTRELTAAPAPV